MSGRIRIVAGLVALVVVASGIWLYATRGRESTDDAQIDAHLTPIASRVGGTVKAVPVTDNQVVHAGDVLAVIDPRDFEVALEHARAELADAEAAAIAARANVPITSTTAASGVSNAQGGVEQAQAGVDESVQAAEAAKARLVTAQARQREAEATAKRTASDVERFRGLLEKDEISRQQFDAAVSAADAARAAADSAASQVAEAELGIKAAQSRVAAARATAAQASAQLRTARTAPAQVTAVQARSAAADARVKQMQATVRQAELNLEYTTIKAPADGIVSKRAAQPGQVVQPGQPLMTLIPDDVWVTANFKETQLRDMRPGQKVKVEVDAYGRELDAHVESVAAATGARFSLIPPDNATGNFVKVVQRVPVRIALDDKQDAEQALRPGLSVTATVYTR